MFLASLRPKLECCSFSSSLPYNTILNRPCDTHSCLNFLFPSPVKKTDILSHCTCFAKLGKSDSEADPNCSHNINTTPKKARIRLQKTKAPSVEDKHSQTTFPTTIPKKPRRGRKNEASAVEDLVRNTLERTFATIREQNPDMLKDKENVIRERVDEESGSEDISDVDDDDDGGATRKNKMVVEEEDPDWPLDADVGWGIRASEYFDQHPIKNVVGEDGVEIDWEGEIDDNWVKEINCLEWERFAFHPSPLIVLVFERYNRASENWKVLKELEKAVQVYLGAKKLLPPRTVKIDINIERDLAYALKVKDCPQILFLRGHKILYREKDFRTADELVQMIAHFYFNAKKPSYIKEETFSPPF